jgi:glucose-1-phosphate cytidylyltransferase
MKVVIFAGGYGTRLSEETAVLPKPLVEIGAMPMLWHIMKIYSAHGLNDFVICCGYKGHLIKRYFLDFFHRQGDFTIDLSTNEVTVERAASEPWRVTLADTGLETMTGGRLAACATISGTRPSASPTATASPTSTSPTRSASTASRAALPRSPRSSSPAASAPSTSPPTASAGRGLPREEPLDGHLINGGFFVCEPGVIDYVEGDATVWEEEPLKGLVRDGQLAVYHHKGFWQNMDTLRDKHVLQEMWDTAKAPWKVWDRAPASARAPFPAERRVPCASC